MAEFTMVFKHAKTPSRIRSLVIDSPSRAAELYNMPQCSIKCPDYDNATYLSSCIG